MRGVLQVGISEINKPEHQTKTNEWINTNLNGPQVLTGENKPGFNLYPCIFWS